MFKNIKYYQWVILLWLGVGAGFAQAVVSLDNGTGTVELPLSTNITSPVQATNSCASGSGTFNVQAQLGVMLPPPSPGITPKYYARFDISSGATFGALPSLSNIGSATLASGGSGSNYAIFEIQNTPSSTAILAFCVDTIQVTNKNPVNLKYSFHPSQLDALNNNLSPLVTKTATYFKFMPTNCANVTEIPSSECQSLLDLYNSTGGANWTNKTGWNENNTPCSWFGVTCSAGHVYQIGLDRNNLKGLLPDLSLPNLKTLGFSYNQLSGNIPDFGNLPNLTGLYLQSNQLSGSIPNFSNLSNLTDGLGLSYNQLSGNIPNFSKLPKLIVLELDSNQLTGGIPNFNNLSSLRLLALSYNQLSGSIPNFTNLSKLQYLQVASNQLTGNVPSFTSFNLANLVSATFNYNCGLTAYDSNQEIVLNQKDPNWKTRNSNCPVSSYNLTLSKVGNGQISGSGSFTAGATVNLTATPDANSIFTGWSPSPCNSSFQMPANNLTCTATFTLKNNSITAVANPIGGGSINCNPNPVNYGSNSVCTAIPNTGYTFNNFSGDCTGTSCTLNNVTSAKNVTANFKANQTITFNTLANKVFGDADFNVSATASSNLPVSFSATGNCSITNSTVKITGAGNCSIKASQVGNTTYNAATDITQTFLISKVNQVLIFNPSLTGTAGQSSTLSATGGLSNSAVVFASLTPTICTVTGNSVAFSAVGTCTITANQVGNANYNAATQVSVNIVVSNAPKIDQTIYFNPVLTGTVGTNATLSATATSGLTAITFASSPSTVCAISGNVVSFVSAGNCIVTANQVGNDKFNAANEISATIVVSNIPKTDQTISFNPVLTGTVGKTANLSATVSSGLTPITFTSSPSTVCTVSGNTISFMSAGNCIVTANQVGNDRFNAAKEISAMIVVSSASKTNQTITFNPVLTGVIGTTANLSATASSGLTPIVFASLSPTVCTISGNVVSFVSEGNCIVSANQAGNEKFYAATLERIISSTVGIFDIKVSYYDTYNNAISRKDQIEDNIRHWADGVYESTNGAHRLGKVEIYTGGEISNNADIVWIASCWPNANPGGRGKAGARIQFCDTFSMSNPMSFLQKSRSGGYTIAHEWGHFAYALFDEYKASNECSAQASSPCKSDVSVSNSIMNSQWNAVGANETLGDLKWLNFSAKLNNDGANITTNAQARIYKASAWETLVRDPSLDPINFGRTFYKGLVAVAPAAGQEPSIELGTCDAATKTCKLNIDAQAKAREKLSFMWKGASTARRAAAGIDKRPMVRIIAIENSANIHPQQLAAVKVAANQLIRKAEIGDVIAVAAFANDTQIISSLTLINSEEDKKNLIQSVKSIQPSTLPSKLETVVHKISDMVQAAVASLPASHPANQYEKDIYLFAQGFMSNNGESIGLGNMISKANDSNVRIFSFALNETTEKTLRVLSEMTHGKSWFTPTLESLRDALSNLLDAASPMLDVIVAADQATFSSNKEFPFSVDSTLGELSISIYYSGTSNGATLSLVAPDGTVQTLTTNECASDNEIAGKNSCLARVSRPATGYWKLQATTNSSGVNVSFDVHALPLDNKEVFFASINALPKITAPNKNVIVEATISGNAVSSYGTTQLPITNLTVSGVAKKPDGTLETLTLHDDGTGNDKQANDGVYTASLTGEISGEYLVTVKLDNKLGSGQFTTAGITYTVAPDGSTPSDTVIPVTNKFERVVQTQVLVKPVLEDYKRVMNWGEAMFAQLNNQPLLVGFDKQDMDIPPYKVRFYPSSNTYLGFNPNDGKMYVYNPNIFGADILSVGEMSSFLIEAQKAEF